MEPAESTSSTERLLVPTHMQPVSSVVNLETLSDSCSESEVETKSRSSGIEVDFDMPITTTPEAGQYRDYEVALNLEGAGDDFETSQDYSSLCSVNLKDYVTELNLLTSAAVIGGSMPGGKVAINEHQPRKRLESSITEIACNSTYQKLKRLSGPTILCLILALIILIWGRGHVLQLLQWLENLPLHQSLLVFICLFTLISFPFGFGYIILNMMAGYLYGVLHGQLIVMISVAVGISVSFLACRKCFKDYAKSIITSNALQAVLRVMEGPYGFKVIFLTRFTPIPFGLQNVVFAMTGVSYLHFLAASVLGLLPTQMLNAYMGSTVRNMQEVLADRVDGYIILGIQIIFSIFLTLYLLNKARRELAKLTRSMDIESNASSVNR